MRLITDHSYRWVAIVDFNRCTAKTEPHPFSLQFQPQTRESWFEGAVSRRPSVAQQWPASTRPTLEWMNASAAHSTQSLFPPFQKCHIYTPALPADILPSQVHKRTFIPTSSGVRRRTWGERICKSIKKSQPPVPPASAPNEKRDDDTYLSEW